MNYVSGIGPSMAKIAIVGDFPKFEQNYLLEECCEAAGIKLEDCYITNIIKYPIEHPGNIARLGINVNEQVENFKNEIKLLDPNVIVCFNPFVLNILTGVKDIKNYRGSILSSFLGIKVIPTIHPNLILYDKSEKDDDDPSEDESKLQWKDLAWLKWDWQRIVRHSQFKGFDPPARDLVIARTALDFWRYLEYYKNKKFVAVDIETFHTIPSCISFSFNSNSAISVPLISFPDFQTTRSDLVQIWKDVATILADPSIYKIGQNFKFDEDKLMKCRNDETFFGLKVNSFYFDTLLAFKTLYPELRSSLGFQASILTEEPYYKEEGKGYNPAKDKADRLLLYNAKDAAITFECYERELDRLRTRGLDEFFFTKVMPMHPFYLAMENRGLRVDTLQRGIIHETAKESLKDLNEELTNLLSVYGIIKFNVQSPKQMKELVFGVMQIPMRKGTDAKTLDALIRNVVKDVSKKRILELIQEIRKVKKLIGTYITAQTHPDGTIKTSYNLILETGRTSTKVYSSPLTTKTMGMALQTITSDDGTTSKVGGNIRSIFIPNDGYIYVEPDLSAAEARIVALLANDPRLIKIFKYNVDIHRVTAGWIDNTSPEGLLMMFYNNENHDDCVLLAKQINDEMKKLIKTESRQTGKMFRHAGNYDIGKRTAGEQAKISEKQAGIILAKFHATNPNIRGVFHKEILDFLKANNRELTTPFGRTRTFLNRWGDNLYKEAYAYLPQSTISDQLKFSMMEISRRVPEMYIQLECHDSFLFSITPANFTDRVIRIIHEEMETPINFDKCSLKRDSIIIPAEIKVGNNWKDMNKI